MTKLKKNAWIELAVSLGVFAVLAVVTALWDLQINKALYFQDCFYAQYFAQLGELPTYLAAPVIGTIFFCQNWGKTKKNNIFFKVLFGAVVFAGWFVAFGVWLWGRFEVSSSFETSTKNFDIVYKVLGAAALTFVTLLLGSRFPANVAKKLFWFAVFYCIVFAVPNVIIAIMKVIWARERFRVMYAIGDFSGFTAWYLPQGFAERSAAYEAIRNAADEALGHSGDAFKSFPSGHTCAASVSFALIILPDVMPKSFGGKKKKIFWIVPIAYTALVALSRVMAGAHYLSDTLFGGFIGFGVACLARWIFISKIKTLNKEPDVSDFEPTTETEESVAEGATVDLAEEGTEQVALTDELAEETAASADSAEA